ncbi:hypothetical protein L8P91_18755 [Enterobacter bugandensis]|uniref:hypothetical protein n=1 Tax=Enterobacter bugandensis TaxID=881260 RepID=UPI000ABFD355|nr:hypothetical protein [Enterobacter bugandensis]MCK7068201.1 hypothetical protein [Enterobacter bugandensis]
MISNKLRSYQNQTATTRISNGFIYKDSISQARTLQNSVENLNTQQGRIKIDDVASVASIISDSFSIYESANALAAVDPNKIKYSIVIKNDGLEFILIDRIRKPSNFSILKSFIYLQPGDRGIIEFEADSYTGVNDFFISYCTVSIDPTITNTIEDVQSLNITETPVVFLNFKLDASRARLSEVGVNEYTRSSDIRPIRNDLNLEAFEFTGTSGTKEPSFIISCIESTARNVKGESISNQVLISASNVRSTLAASRHMAGENFPFSGWRPLHQLQKDILTQNIRQRDNDNGRGLITSIITALGIITSLTVTGLNIANALKSRTKESDKIRLSINLVNMTELDVYYYGSIENVTRNSPGTCIRSGMSVTIPLMSLNNDNPKQLRFSLRSPSSNSIVDLIVWVEFHSSGTIYIKGVRFGTNTLSNAESIGNTVKNYYYRHTSSPATLGRKFITVGTSSIAGSKSGDLQIMLFSN